MRHITTELRDAARGITAEKVKPRASLPRDVIPIPSLPGPRQGMREATDTRPDPARDAWAVIRERC
jgi:hypothetical protein